MSSISYESLSGKQKAAILLVAIGPDASKSIFSHLSDEEIEALGLEIADLDVIPKEVRVKVIEEFYEMALAQEYISKGGLKYAKDLLVASLGPQKAGDVIRRVQGALEKRDFHLLKNVDAQQLVNFIQNEHPQTIALILSHLESRQSAEILGRLREELQANVALRIATMEQASPDIVQEVEDILEEKTSMLSKKDSKASGVDAIVNILIEADRNTERKILEGIEEENPEIANEIKNRMFVFEDIIMLDDRSIQRLLKEVDTNDLQLALKAASDELKALIFKNMSTRASTLLKEDLEMLGPVKLKIVEEAQQKIVGIIRKLEEDGEIAGVARGGKEEEIVV